MNGLTPFLGAIIALVTLAQLAGINKRNNNKPENNQDHDVNVDVNEGRVSDDNNPFEA